MPTALETAKFLHERHRLLRSIPNYSESDTIDYLINPVLDHLGFTAEYRMRENQQDKNRPDFSLWPVPVALRTGTTASTILEAKPLGLDLTGRKKSRVERPKEQLQRYVNGYEFSQPGTYGILTDGAIWHIVRKNATETRAPLVNELELFRGTAEHTAKLIEEIEQILKAGEQPTPTPQPQPKLQQAIQVCKAVAEGKSPQDVLKQLAGNDEFRTSLKEHVAGLQIEAANCGCYSGLSGSRRHFQEKALLSRFGGFLNGFDSVHLVVPHGPRPQEIFAHLGIPQRSSIYGCFLADLVEFSGFRKGQNADWVARFGKPVVVEVAVGQEYVVDADAVSVVASLLLAGQRRCAGGLCFQ